MIAGLSPLSLRFVGLRGDLYKRGFIEPVYDCEHLSPVVLVKKPPKADGTSRGWRMVVNMIARNQTLENIANRIANADW